MRISIVVSFLSISALGFVACGGSNSTDDSSTDSTLMNNGFDVSPADDAGSSRCDASGCDAGAGEDSGPSNDPGPKPDGTCTISKDANGFFTRNLSLGSYVAYVPASYSPDTPMRLIVGLHGCGDNAMNFAGWAINPDSTRAKQQYIGIAVDGATYGGGCWNVGVDDPVVLAAVGDISQCFWVDQKKITVAGYSSGGIVAYNVGLKNASRFAGILIEDSGLYPVPGGEDALLANASRKIPIAHRAHQNDTEFPLDQVQADWTKIAAAGFPLTTDIVSGTHDGTSADWSNMLIPASAGWTLP